MIVHILRVNGDSFVFTGFLRFFQGLWQTCLSLELLRFHTFVFRAEAGIE